MKLLVENQWWTFCRVLIVELLSVIFTFKRFVLAGVQPVVCGRIVGSGRHDAVAGETQMLQFQLRGKDWRCWEEDRGKVLIDGDTWSFRVAVNKRCWWRRWRASSWWWVATTAAACSWAGEGRAETPPPLTKRCRPAGPRGAGAAPTRCSRSWTGTALLCSTAPCRPHSELSNDGNDFHPYSGFVPVCAGSSPESQRSLWFWATSLPS